MKFDFSILRESLLALSQVWTLINSEFLPVFSHEFNHVTDPYPQISFFIENQNGDVGTL